MSTESAATGSKPLRIGKYEIVRHIATGGMGAVYRARDVEAGREVALKVLSPQMDPAKRRTRLERFRMEALNANRLRHPNIAAIYDCGGGDEIYWLALEFIDGPDLQDYIARKGQLSFEESRSLIIQAVRALNHLHKNGLVHRDIKPSNFLVTQKDGKSHLTMIDLGLARRISDDPGEAQFRVTQEGATLGTIDYMAPEQARDSTKADVRSDIYSLGCTWFHMLVGRPPFPEGNMMERLVKHLQEPPPDVRQFNPSMPEPAAAVLKRMLAKNPDDRYATPAALLKDLEAAQGQIAAQPAVDAVAALAAAESLPETEAGPETPRPTAKRRTKVQVVARSAEDKPEAKAAPESTSPLVAALLEDWIFWLAVGGAVLIALIAFVILLKS